MGAAEYLLQDHVLGWGLTRIKTVIKRFTVRAMRSIWHVEMELHPGDMPVQWLKHQ